MSYGNKKIYVHSEINELCEELKSYDGLDIYCTSGGFDPLHVGHLRCIQHTAKMCQGGRSASGNAGIFVVIVNGDGFLYRKKGYAFMTHTERMEIVAGIEGVDYVVGWDDGSQTVTGALQALKPNYFTKGGDRDSASNVPEFDLCEKIGCKVVFNVGGGKIRSSSELAKVAMEGEIRKKAVDELNEKN
jgi:D-beta-D-heptose 7-phosphate kinase/D-beta-D-heptose 1-phosphate adenosyltransferase